MFLSVLWWLLLLLLLLLVVAGSCWSLAYPCCILAKASGGGSGAKPTAQPSNLWMQSKFILDASLVVRGGCFFLDMSFFLFHRGSVFSNWSQFGWNKIWNQAWRNYPEAFLKLCLENVLTLNKSGKPSIWMVCFSPNQSYHSWGSIIFSTKNAIFQPFSATWHSDWEHPKILVMESWTWAVSKPLCPKILLDLPPKSICMYDYILFHSSSRDLFWVSEIPTYSIQST